MQFEIGKYYKHSSGKMMAILAYANITIYGRAMVAEEGNAFDYRLVEVDAGDYAANWKEIDEEEWLLRSPKKEEQNKYPIKKEEDKKITDEMKIYLEGYREGQLDLMREFKK